MRVSGMADAADMSPVINVSWDDAVAYAEWLSEETGWTYRLLSEAEWEYVARAGTQTARYWGEGELGQCRNANGFDRTAEAEVESPTVSAACSDGFGRKTAPVGSFLPNSFGLYDILGNVWEWTQDCWNESYSGAPTDGSGWQSGDYCARRTRRGGSAASGPVLLRSAGRSWRATGNPNSITGFRVARTMN